MGAGRREGLRGFLSQRVEGGTGRKLQPWVGNGSYGGKESQVASMRSREQGFSGCGPAVPLKSGGVLDASFLPPKPPLAHLRVAEERDHLRGP